MNPLRHDLQHLAYVVRRWFANRRMRREEAVSVETLWLDDLTDQESPYTPWSDEKKGRRHSGRHARPGDIPNQPPAGRQS